MKKLSLIIIIAFFLVSCRTVSTMIESAYTGIPAWALMKPEEKDYSYFVSSSDADSSSQRYNENYRELLSQVSAELGYEVTGTYYRELSTLGTISDLGFRIKETKENEGVLYMLAEADRSVFDTMRSPEYIAMRDRLERIEALSAEAMEYYRFNNDIAALDAWIRAADVLSDGPVPGYSAEEFLSKAAEIARNIRFRIADRSPETGECTLIVSRDKGVLSPRVTGAPILVTIQVHDHDDGFYSYSYREVTGDDGKVSFSKKYPRMADIGSVEFSLDLSTKDITYEPLVREIEDTRITFDYAIESRTSREGIVTAFSEYDENGEELSSSWSEKAFVTYLEKDGISVTVASISGSEWESVLSEARERFPDKKYIIWSRVGRDAGKRTPLGDYVISSQGYTVLADLETGEIISYDYDTQSVAWGRDLDAVTEELFTSYGRLTASQFTRYL
ncbi:MAG: hypothetical protein ACI4NM_10475 [Bullifex sp.]